SSDVCSSDLRGWSGFAAAGGDGPAVEVHVAVGADAPAEVGGHAGAAELVHVRGAVVVGGAGPADGVVEGAGGGVLKEQPGAGAVGFLVLCHGVDEAAGGARHRHGAVAHRVELGQPAGLGAARHDEKIAAGDDQPGEVGVVANVRADASSVVVGGPA